MAGSNSLARMLIDMWNSHFSKVIKVRENDEDIKWNIVKMFTLSSTTRNSNKKMNIAEYKNPDQNILLKSKDKNKIAASIWLNDTHSNKWIIAIHGYNSSRISVLYLVWHYRSLGYNIMTFDFRNHGQSGKDIVTWGYKEKWDLISSIEWLKKVYNPEMIGLVGTSMGGFTLNYFMLTEPEIIKNSNIKWGIADSPYMSVPMQLEKMIINNTPQSLTNPALSVLESMINIYKNEYDVDLMKLDFLKLIQPNKEYIPMMYIHNRGDKVTRYLDSFRMFTAKENFENKNQNKLLIYNGKHHTKSIIEYKEDYIKQTIDFVLKNEK